MILIKSRNLVSGCRISYLNVFWYLEMFAFQIYGFYLIHSRFVCVNHSKKVEKLKARGSWKPLVEEENRNEGKQRSFYNHDRVSKIYCTWSLFTLWYFVILKTSKYLDINRNLIFEANSVLAFIQSSEIMNVSIKITIIMFHFFYICSYLL